MDSKLEWCIHLAPFQIDGVVSALSSVGVAANIHQAAPATHLISRVDYTVQGLETGESFIPPIRRNPSVARVAECLWIIQGPERYFSRSEGTL